MLLKSSKYSISISESDVHDGLFTLSAKDNEGNAPAQCLDYQDIYEIKDFLEKALRLLDRSPERCTGEDVYIAMQKEKTDEVH